MKKTVLAAAILSLTTGAAMAAGNSLQVYGKIDLSAESINNGTSTTTALTSGNSVTSRLGFKGTEDLGGGLMGMFVLESGISPDTGAVNATRFFDRSAWVGLKGNFGTLRLGHMDSLLGQVTGNPSVLGNQNFDDFKIGGMEGSASNRRIDNAIAYALPTLVDGLNAEIQYSLAPGSSAAAGVEGGQPKQYGLSVGYKIAGFNVGVASLINRANVNNKQGGTLAQASYDFGMMQLIGYYQVDQEKVAGVGSEKRKLMGLHLNAPIGANTKLLTSFAQARNVTTKTARFVDGAKSNIFTLEVDYSLSKRTYLYSMFTNVSNKGGATAGIGGDKNGTANESARGLAVGIVHSF